MKLYFYKPETECKENGESETRIVCKEAEARETPKLYLPVSGNDGFPCYLTRLPKERVDSNRIEDGFVIMTQANDESARAVFRQHYERNAEYYAQRAAEAAKYAKESRKIAASL